MKEIRYREHLFDVLSSNVDEVFLIYNRNKNALEYVSANCRRVLELEGSDFSGDSDILAQRVIQEDRAAFAEFVKPKGGQAGQYCDLRMRYPSGDLRWIRFQVFPEVINRKIERYIVSVSDRSEEMRREQTLKDALVNAQNANAAKQNFLSV
ncbi:MAG: hypothetical protein ACLRVT_06385 [Oscillospiraceae bacterium]